MLRPVQVTQQSRGLERVGHRRTLVPLAGSPDTVIQALRQIAKVTRGGMQLNWPVHRVLGPRSIAEQQQMIGRFRGSGAPLDGQNETDIPNYAEDPAGQIVPLTAHIRLSNPRTRATADSLILRRSYNYDPHLR